jgi:Type VI secretion system VasI, EvfG, VC_A0118
MPADTISTELLARSVSPEIPAGTEAVSANEPNGIGSPKSPAGSVLTEMPTATASPDKLTAAVPPDIPTKTVDVPTEPPDTNWVVSQTTSPVDYSPLITAAIRSTSSEKDALNTLTIRCRQLRTELLLRTEGTWHISRASEVQVQYQINDQSSDGLRWAVSADGKYATYKDDAVGLLRSLPDGARLKIHVFDGPGHDATFQLTGLDAIRKKIAVACKWAPAADKTSSAKR